MSLSYEVYDKELSTYINAASSRGKVGREVCPDRGRGLHSPEEPSSSGPGRTTPAGAGPAPSWPCVPPASSVCGPGRSCTQCSTLSLVQTFRVVLRQQSYYAIKNQFVVSKALLLAGSLWHKDSWLQCTERSYYRRPNAIKPGYI